MTRRLDFRESSVLSCMKLRLARCSGESGTRTRTRTTELADERVGDSVQCFDIRLLRFAMICCDMICYMICGLSHPDNNAESIYCLLPSY